MPGPAFITGGSSGIGLAFARALAAKGHPVALFARDADRLAQAAASLPEAQTFVCDVRDAQAVETQVAQATSALGPPELAIANAGIAEPGLFEMQALTCHQTQMDVNYFGALHFAQACTPHMSLGSKLIFISSGAALFGIYGYSAYAPSKFAMRGLAEVLRVELAARGISVTLAYPPDTDTPQLVAEARTKPRATKAITGSAGVWQPDAVAAKVLRAADKGRFAVAPGAQLTALLWLHAALGPALRWWQIRVARKHPEP